MQNPLENGSPMLQRNTFASARPSLSFVAAACLLTSALILSGCPSESTDSGGDSTPAVEKLVVKDLRQQTPLTDEPEYNNQPLYGLLASDVMASKLHWLVIDGDTIYVDRNCDGRLVADEAQPFSPDSEVALKAALGADVRMVSTAPTYSFGEFIKSLYPERLENNWRLYSLLPQFGNPIGFWLSPEKNDAVVTYLRGPLAFTLARPVDCELSREEALKFDVKVAIAQTMAAKQDIGQPQTRTIFAPLLTRDCAEEFSPVATFYFPHEDQTKPPVVKEVRLKQRC